jgi:plasmid stability protein
LTVRNLDQDVYEGLKDLATRRSRSMEAEARDLLREGVDRRRRWAGAKLADLSGDPEIWDVETPYVRSSTPPREARL